MQSLMKSTDTKMPGQKKSRARAVQMQPEERRKQLLRAGVASFASKGIGATKHADLARACQVSVPTVFSYFPNRGALVTSILEEVGIVLIEGVITPARLLPKQEQLRATGPLYIELAEREPDYVKVWLMWSMHFAPELQKHYRKFETLFVQSLAEMIREGSSEDDPCEDTRDRARMILASSTVLAKMVFDGVSEKRRQDFVRHVLQPIAVG